MRLVSVVTSTRSRRDARSRISASRSSTCPRTGPDLDHRIDQPGRPDDLLDDRAARLAAARRGPASPTRTAAGRPASPTPRSSAAGCRAPTAAGSRRRRALPCATGRRDTCRGPAARSGGSRRRSIERVGRQVVEQRRRRLARRAPGQVPRVVLDPVAVADLLDHLEIEHRPLVQAVRLEDLALRLELSAVPRRARP